MKTSTLSIRIPEDISSQLDRISKSARRSRSFVVKEALTVYFTELDRGVMDSKSRLDTLRALKGAGARQYGAMSTNDIISDIRNFRGDEA